MGSTTKKTKRVRKPHSKTKKHFKSLTIYENEMEKIASSYIKNKYEI